MKLYPLKFHQIYKQRIWGGQKLRTFFNKDIPAGEKIGESWEIADLPKDKSIIANGLLAGQSLNSVIAKYPKEITGDEGFRGAFPLLIKFLDAEDILSVQVHPDPQACRQIGSGEPKTECWYIISAAPGAVIYKGLREGVTKQQFTRAIENGTVADMLQEISVEAGQCHFLPAGTVHSIGAGLLIAEIQTPSDTTYRVFDWDRTDKNGEARRLHIQEALQSIHFDASGDNLSVTTSGRLVDCEYFRIDKFHQTQNCQIPVQQGKMKVLVILVGSGEISDSNGNAVEFKAGDCILIPALYEGTMQFADNTQYLTVILNTAGEY